MASKPYDARTLFRCAAIARYHAKRHRDLGKQVNNADFKRVQKGRQHKCEELAGVFTFLARATKKREIRGAIPAPESKP